MHRSRREERQRAHRRGVVILGLCGVFVASSAAILISTQPGARETSTNCLLAGKLAQQTVVVVVDRTESWSENQASLLRAALGGIARSIGVDERLSIVPFDGYAERPPVALFDKCKIKSGQSVNLAIATPSIVEAEYQKDFAQPLEKSLMTISKSGEAKQTHLVEFIRNVAAHLTLENRAENLRIIIYSDLAENTSEFSAYKKWGTESFVKHWNSTMRDRLSKVTLEIVVLPMSNRRDLAPRLKAAWKEALKQSGVAHTMRDF